MTSASRLHRITGGRSAAPIGVLFALNLVDELDQVTYGVVAPEIRDTFGVSETAITTIAALAAATVIMLVVPVGFVADRYNRVRLVTIAALAWGTMTVLTGLSGFVGAIGLLVLARFGAGLGRVMNEPVHVSLLADYYQPVHHGKVFSFHRMANPVGGLFVLLGGALADLVGWRVGFMLLSVPTFIAALFVSRLREPARGASIDQSIATELEEHADRIPFGEATRRLRSIPSLRRTWVSAVFLGAALVPIAVFFNFFFEEDYGIESATARGAITMLYAVGSIIGLQIGSKRSTEMLMAGDVSRLPVAVGVTQGIAAASLLAMALSPWLVVSIAAVLPIGALVAGNSFGLPMLTAVCPPRLRSQGIGWYVFFIGVGAIVITPIVSGIGEGSGYRFGIAVLSLLLVASALIFASAAPFVRRDAEQAFNALMTESQLRREMADTGERALLVCRGVEVAYDQVQVLFGVDLEVHRGEIVALLGTNGAGKSTLLKAISGTVDPFGGSIFLDGRDVTHADAQQTASMGIVQVPGGKAVFPTLTVGEHLRAAGWLYRGEPDHLARATEEVLEIFPRLRERHDQMAGNLSGGEQQMLALGMAFIARPRLLMIDELSLGLAPTIVEQLLGIVRRIQASGTAIVLVEQSINVALTVAERAYFLEKGEVRFEGDTAALLERDDIVRSVFLGGATGDGISTRPRPKVAVGSSDGNGRGNGSRGSPAAIALEARDLVCRFGGIRAVDGASFRLHAGEILGLIGPNGAGKTTIFDLVSGFLSPDGGRILLGDTDVTALSPDARARLGLGRSFQDARLVPSLTVAENIAISLERHLAVRDPFAAALALPGVVRQEEDVAWTVADLIELMSLGAYRDKFVRELSTGSRRVVDLAMCIAHEPDVLLLDEPSSGIAQRETEALGPLLERIQHETGCALLVIEHDMPLITSISHRMIGLELGRPIAEGTPAEVTSDPRVVSSYLGGSLAAIQRSGPVESSRRRLRRRQPLVAARHAEEARP